MWGTYRVRVDELLYVLPVGPFLGVQLRDTRLSDVVALFLLRLSSPVLLDVCVYHCLRLLDLVSAFAESFQRPTVQTFQGLLLVVVLLGRRLAQSQLEWICLPTSCTVTGGSFPLRMRGAHAQFGQCPQGDFA